MSDTALSLVTDSLEAILIQASEQSVQPADFRTGIRYLNRMMNEFDAQGLALGYTVVDDPDDLITVPAGALNGIMFNLAVRLSVPYDMPISPGLAIAARDGMQALRKVGFQILPSSFGSTLPLGSGNEGELLDSTTHFYPGDEDEALTEDFGSILLESDTND